MNKNWGDEKWRQIVYFSIFNFQNKWIISRNSYIFDIKVFKSSPMIALKTRSSFSFIQLSVHKCFNNLAMKLGQHFPELLFLSSWHSNENSFFSLLHSRLNPGFYNTARKLCDLFEVWPKQRPSKSIAILSSCWMMVSYEICYLF